MPFRLPYVAALTAVLTLAACRNAEAPNDAVQSSPTASQAPAPAPPTTEARRVVFLGNSITAGYGLDPDEAFPALIQQKIDSLGWDFTVENAGVSGDITAGGVSRIDWLLDAPVAALVIELGGNDGLRGLPIEGIRANLTQIIERTRARYPQARIVLAGMQIPPNLGARYATDFRDVFPAVAEATGADFVPFVLENVGGVTRLNQNDGIHPTAEGHRIVAGNVWNVLGPVLRELHEAETVG